MKAAAVYPNKKVLGLVNDFPMPGAIGPKDVKLRIHSVGVCGTDREIASWQYGLPPAGFEYLVLGHEAIGEVVEVGPEVQDLKPGDFAVPTVRRPCSRPDCAACRARRQDFCQTGEFKERGINQLQGFMTEFVVDEDQYMNLVPAAIKDVAVMVEPLTIASKAIIQAMEVQNRLPWGLPGKNASPGQYQHKALVLGAGPVGLLGAMTLQLAGFDVTVYSLELAPNPAATIVESIGAHYISSKELNVDQMAAKIGNIDVVYEATGASHLAFDVLRVIGINALFILTGIPAGHGTIPVEGEAIMRNMVLKNQCLLGTVNAGKDAFERAVADLTQFNAKWPQAVAGLITGRFPIEQFQDPINHPAGIKNVIEIAR